MCITAEPINTSKDTTPISIEKQELFPTAGVATLEYDLAISPVQKELVKMPMDEVTTVAVATPKPPETAPEVSGDTPMMSKKDVELIALVAMGEAENQSELGKRLVIDTVLNRMDHYGDTASEIIYAPGQYTCMWDGRIKKCYVREDIVQLVQEELENRTNYDVIYFRTGHYHNFGTPIMPEGAHYFSGF